MSEIILRNVIPVSITVLSFLFRLLSFPRRRESSKILYYVYILASKKNGTLYIGVTNNLERRTYEHKCGLIEGFTKNYDMKNLVYFETTNDINSAILKRKAAKEKE